MKVRDHTGQGLCEACGSQTPELYPVTFERADEVRLLCKKCLEWTRELLSLVDVKEAEA